MHSLLCLLHLSYETCRARRQCSVKPGRRTEFWVAYIRLNPRVKGLCNPCWFLVPATLSSNCKCHYQGSTANYMLKVPSFPFSIIRCNHLPCQSVLSGWASITTPTKD